MQRENIVSETNKQIIQQHDENELKTQSRSRDDFHTHAFCTEQKFRINGLLCTELIDSVHMVRNGLSRERAALPMLFNKCAHSLSAYTVGRINEILNPRETKRFVVFRYFFAYSTTVMAHMHPYTIELAEFLLGF